MRAIFSALFAWSGVLALGFLTKNLELYAQAGVKLWPTIGYLALGFSGLLGLAMPVVAAKTTFWKWTYVITTLYLAYKTEETLEYMKVDLNNLLLGILGYFFIGIAALIATKKRE